MPRVGSGHCRKLLAAICHWTLQMVGTAWKGNLEIESVVYSNNKQCGKTNCNFFKYILVKRSQIFWPIFFQRQNDKVKIIFP